MLSYKRSLPLKLLVNYPKNCNNIFNYLPKRPYLLSGSVRTGLLDIISSLSFNKEDIVLMPSFVPEGLILPFKLKKVKLEFYGLKGNFQIDIEDLTSNINKNIGKIKAIVIIHYFGIFEKQIYDVRRLCDNYKITLIEDCVHGLFSKSSNLDFYGVVGDISFFSLPKFLPVTDGAIFLINNTNININWSANFSMIFCIATFCHTISLLIRHFAQITKSRFIFISVSIVSKFFYLMYYKLLCSIKRNVGISRISKRIMQNIDYDEFVEKKISGYNYYNKHLITSKLFSKMELLPSGIMVPISPGFPIILNQERNKLIRNLKKEGVEVLAYQKRWNFMRNRNNYDSKYIIDHHILLPINHTFTSHDYCLIINKINLVLNENTN